MQLSLIWRSRCAAIAPSVTCNQRMEVSILHRPNKTWMMMISDYYNFTYAKYNLDNDDMHYASIT